MEHFSWYSLIPQMESFDGWLRENGIIGQGESGQHIISALLILLLLIGIAAFISKRYANPETNLVPPKKVGLSGILEVLIEWLDGLVGDVIGHGYEKHFPLLSATFIFIVLCNLLGCIPGFPPPTSTISTTAAISVTIFLYYNYVGFRAHGAGYVKHFMGPVWWLAWLMLPIELVSHLVRPVSLSLRLAGNITGDHMVLGIFTAKTFLVIPAIFVGLGFFVALVQAFVFTLLSTIYIGMAGSHDH